MSTHFEHSPKISDLKISLDSAVTEIFDNNEFLNRFKQFNVTATEQDINEFVDINDESSNCSMRRY